MLLWLTQHVTDFCRWRAYRAHKRAERALRVGFEWLETEKFIIEKVIEHGEKAERRLEQQRRVAFFRAQQAGTHRGRTTRAAVPPPRRIPGSGSEPDCREGRPQSRL